jgi:Site-specific recombinase XerD
LGYPIDPKTYPDLFKRLVKRAKIQNINFHSLRRALATRALEKGIPAKTVSEILGHANILQH